MKLFLVICMLSLLSIPASPQEKGTFTDSRDKKEYKWVKIGSQIWMAQNLAYKPRTGVARSYENQEMNLTKYGYLYDWETAKNICPEGWHLPSLEEFTELVETAGSDPGTKLKAKSGWSRDGNGTDLFGFSALPGGKLFPPKEYSQVELLGYFWSSTYRPPGEMKMPSAIHLYMSCSLKYIQLNPAPTNLAMSVRCLKDK